MARNIATTESEPDQGQWRWEAGITWAIKSYG